jgi:hypothetical protein
MKEISRRARVFLAVAFLAVLTACATHGTQLTSTMGQGERTLSKPDARVDRLVTKTSETEGSVFEIDLIQVMWKNPDGTPRMHLNETTKKVEPMITTLLREHRTTPFGRDLTISVINGPIPALINRDAVISAAKAGACPTGAICNSNVNVNDVAAVAQSQGGHGGVGLGVANSQAGAASNSGASLNSGCSTCNLPPAPVKPPVKPK